MTRQMKLFTRAVRRVQRELERYGFWDQEMAEVEVRLTPFSLFLYGRYDARSPSERQPAQAPRPLPPAARAPGRRDPHEYAHALEDVRWREFTGRAFHRAYGTPYEYHPELYVSRYAAKNSSEDFAETFMLYLKHRGRLPKRFRSSKTIKKKWRFIRRLSGKEV